jgi:hypothetical protein
MSPRVKTELAVCREMHVTWRSRVPDARAVAERDRPLQFLESEGLSVTAPGVPPNYPDPSRLITDDCIRAS